MTETVTYIEQKDIVADWFIQNSHNNKVSITPKKLQKLLYYAYSWGLVFLNETSNDLSNKLFSGNFEAWVHGPVDAEIYQNYKHYGYTDIEQNSEHTTTIGNIEANDILNQVWNAYGKYDANQLEHLTHQEQPWIEARHGLDPLSATTCKINDATIFKFYGSQLV